MPVEVEVVDEALLLKVADGVVVGVGEEVHDAVAEVVLLHLVHQSGAVPLDLWQNKTFIICVQSG